MKIGVGKKGKGVEKNPKIEFLIKIIKYYCDNVFPAALLGRKSRQV